MPKVAFTCDDCGFESYYKRDSCPDCEVKQLRAIVAKLPKWADSLVDALNQLHGIQHTGMGRRTVARVEKQIREAAKAAGEE